MFDINETKTFMDSVHGYISIPKCFVENLVDTEYFQRLRNIDQTGMRILYPDGKHDRFGHSLGVFHLGSKAVDSLLNNFSHDKYWNIYSDYNSILFWAKNKILFLIACLLHDIGHAPFSHSLEKEIHSNSFHGKFEEELAELINKKECGDDERETDDKIKSTDIKKSSPHEQIGAMVIINELSKNIERVFDNLIEKEYPNINVEGILYAEHYEYNPIIKKEELDKDICFIARMVLGLKYKCYTPEKQIKNCFIELLNGSNFDVDKLDYIIRDTKMSGISNISIDVERLLNSISIVTKTVYNDVDFCNDERFSGLTVHTFANEDKNSKIKISGSFRAIFKLMAETSVKLSKGSKFISLKSAEGDARIKFAKSTDIAQFDKVTLVYKDSEPIRADEGAGGKKILSPSTNNSPFKCYIENATVESDEGFYFEVCEPYKTELEINGKCDIEIYGKFASKTSITFFNSTNIDGCIKEIIVLKNLIDNEVPNSKSYNTFSIGFKKQAINIIANVLEARDYLYLWCYAHHKIIYYANFLIPAISSNIFGLENEKEEFPTWSLTYKNIINLDDAYFWTAVRVLKNRVNGPLYKICSELLSRKYKVSVWKSLAEYDLFFESFDDDQKLCIRNFLSNNIKFDMPNVCGNRRDIYSAGFVDERFLRILKLNNSLDNISDVVFVDASYRQKNTDPHNTFIIINDEVISLDKVPLLTDRIKISQRKTTHYFYLYYDTVNDKNLTIEEHNSFKQAMLKFFEDNIDNLDMDKLVQKYELD